MFVCIYVLLGILNAITKILRLNLISINLTQKKEAAASLPNHNDIPALVAGRLRASQDGAILVGTAYAVGARIALALQLAVRHGCVVDAAKGAR